MMDDYEYEYIYSDEKCPGYDEQSLPTKSISPSTTIMIPMPKPEENQIEHYMNLHFQNENQFWNENGRTLPEMVLNHLSKKDDMEFQRGLINYFLLLVAANESYRNNSLDFRRQWEFCRNNPKYLMELYKFIDNSDERCAIEKYKSMFVSKDLKRQFEVFQKVRIWEYYAYMMEVFNHYEKYSVCIPESILDYLLEEEYNKDRIRYFMNWYIPCLESLIACIHMKIDFLDENRYLFRAFFLAKNIKNVSGFFQG